MIFVCFDDTHTYYTQLNTETHTHAHRVKISSWHNKLSTNMTLSSPYVALFFVLFSVIFIYFKHMSAIHMLSYANTHMKNFIKTKKIWKKLHRKYALLYEKEKFFFLFN